MKLAHLGTTSKNGGCPELYASDRGTFVVQGTTVTDPDLLALVGRPLSVAERVVEIPQALFAVAAFTVGAAAGGVVDTGRGTYLVRGLSVTDAEALATLRSRGLSDHETAVEIAAHVLAPTVGA